MKAPLLFACMIAGFFTITALAQDDVDTLLLDLLESERENLPVEGSPLYDFQDLGKYDLTWAFGATMDIVDADTAMPFGKAFSMYIKRAGTNAWDPQLMTPANSIQVNRGDILLYTFYIRTTDTESPNDFGKSEFFVQKASSPWTGMGSLSMALGTSWRKLYVVGKPQDNYAPGEMRAVFHLGFMEQEVEIGGMLALNLGPDVDVDSLPGNDVVYQGMEPDAAWRADAADRIEAQRKGDFTIEVRDEDGNLVENAAVGMRMVEHQYGFGNFVSDSLLTSPRYQEHQLDLFNVATTPFYMGGNHDNWGWYGSGNAQTVYPALAGWLQEHEVPTKGHVLVWPGWEWMPSFFEDMKGDPEALRARIQEHLDLIVPIGREKGLYEWDVVNEPFINHDVMDILGEEVMVDWYRQVRDLDPGPRLILNEYSIIMGGGRFDFQENFERVIKLLQEHDAPLGGIGMQCHFDENLTGIPALLDILDRFAELGLPIQITEFDVAIRDEQLQADYLRDFYTAVFSHPATDKIVMWGFFEKVMWKPLGALVRSDWSYKPNYHVYKDLVYGQWWTPEASGSTDTSGEFALRGFRAYYDISVEIGDSSYVLEHCLLDRDTTLVLDPDAFVDHTSVKELPFSNHPVAAYPNPCVDELMLRFQVDRPGEMSFSFYSAEGQLVRQESRCLSASGVHSTRFDLSGLEPGIFACMVESPDTGAPLAVLKIIKN